MSDEAKLLPCPFCGSPAELEKDSDHHGEWFNLGCSRHWGKDDKNHCIGGLIFYTESELTVAEGIRLWNERSDAIERIEPAPN